MGARWLPGRPDRREAHVAGNRHLSAGPFNAMCPVVSQEYVNGQLKNKYGDAFIRGNNG